MELLDTYRGLADESRLRILHILSHGHFNVQELTTILELSQSTVSHHLKILQQAHLADVHREGTWAYYSANGKNPNSVQSKISNHFLDLVRSASDQELSELIEADKNAINSILDKRREEAKRYFEQIAPAWRKVRESADGHASYLDELVAAIPSDLILLELGCGSGALFEKILPRKAGTIGVDYSQAMLDEARNNLGKQAKNVDLRLGYLEHLPLADQSVEIVAAYMVLHHVAQPLDALKDAHRVLKPGGKLAILDLCSHKNELMRERYADLWLGFSPKQFESWCETAGFSSCSSKVLGSAEEAFILTANKKGKL